jgi:hypothetical protein
MESTWHLPSFYAGLIVAWIVMLILNVARRIPDPGRIDAPFWDDWSEVEGPEKPDPEADI